MQKQIERIRQEIIHGNYKQALDLAEDIKKREDLSKKDQLSAQIFASEILNKMGRYEEAKEPLEDILKESKAKGMELIRIDTLIQKAFSFLFLGMYDETLKTLTQIEQFLPMISNYTKETISKRRASYLSLKMVYHWYRGEVDQIIFDLFDDLSKTAKESNDVELIFFSEFYFFQYYYMFQVDLEKAKKYLNNCFHIAEQLKNDFWIGLSYFIQGHLIRRERNYRKALDHMEKAITLVEESGSTHLLVNIYNDISINYRMNFNLEKAEKYLQKAIKISRNIGATFILFGNLGDVYYHLGDLDLALDYFLKALEICDEIKEKLRIKGILYLLTNLELERGNIDEAKKYLARLEQIAESSEDKYDGIRYQIAQAMVLKNETSFRDWNTAIDILENLMQEELDPYNETIVLQILTELLLRELQQSGKDETMVEIKKQIKRMLAIAKEQKFEYLKFDIRRLQANLALLELNYGLAKEILEKIVVDAEKKGLQKTATDVKRDLQELEKHSNLWEKLRKENSPIITTLKHVALEQSVKRIRKDTTIEVRDERTGDVIEYRKLFSLKI